MATSSEGKRISSDQAEVLPPNMAVQNEDMEKLPRWTKPDKPPTETSTRSKIVNAQFILLNTLSTVTIVFMNKIIFTDTQLANCQITIAMWHFLCTFLVLYVVTLPPFNLFPAIRLPTMQMLPISAFFAGFLLLGNLSLAFNSIGFYQLAKVMTTPTVVLLNFLLFGTKVSGQTLLAIAAVCIGVTLVNAKLALSNMLGTTIAIAAFTITALYQIWIGKKISDLNVTAPQLLLNQAPVSVLLLACVSPFIDTPPAINLIPANILWTLFGSGILASLLNLSQFLIIRKTSALTFNIVSNLKTIIIVSLSWWMDGRVPDLRDMAGVSLALGGAYAYSQFSAKK